MDLPRLTYFGSRGRAELTRLTCALAGISYEERSVGTWNPANLPDGFLALRREGVLAFEQLPMWEEPGGLRLVQSDAIVRHLARANGLYGHGAREMARVDEVMEGVKDVRAEFAKLAHAAPEARDALRTSLGDHTAPRWLGFFDRLLARNEGAFGFIGHGPTVADVALYQWLETLRDNDLFPADASRWSRVVGLESRLMAIPRFNAYVTGSGRHPVQRLPR